MTARCAWHPAEPFKAYCTHQGFHGASAALQVFGGYGFIAEYGIEQCVRDARIAMIYEGTNEIQAIDLVQRKVLADRGATLELLLIELDAEVKQAQAHADIVDIARGLAEALSAARAGTKALAERALNSADPEAALMVADDYLMGLSHTLLAWAFCTSARAALGHEDASWAAAKLARMRYGMQWITPVGQVHWDRVRQGDLRLPPPTVLTRG